jgi:glycosyltransferase involved in cell wall biosynthesis
MTNPRVSILMPVYNVAPYLREAMDSILTQTFQDLELIVLDDCSPDNSAEILDTYTDERIVRYRGEKNMGLSNVLNVGMAMARGEFIARMDSDDISTPERLATQVAYLDAHPEVDLCSCGMELFGAKQETWVRETNVEDVKITALFHSPILHASSMWRREAFERVGLRFLQEMVPAEDYDMWTRAMAAGLRLVNIPEVMYHYRIHPSQATTQTDKTAKKDREVKANYLRMLYPTEDISAVNLLPAQSASDLERIKQSVAHLLEANKRAPFFEVARLEKRLWNYYYRQVINCLSVGFKWRLVGELSWKWRIKWLLKK